MLERLRDVVRSYNEEFYILGTFMLALLLITAMILPLVPHHDFWPVMAALLLALLPATQGAVDLVNGMVTALMKTEALPKLDFSKGIPQEAATLVVVPTLLLNERQVEDLLDELEARYLSQSGSESALCAADGLPDSRARPPDPDEGPLVDLAARAIDELNVKYARRSRRIVSAAASASRLQCPPGRVDGVGAQARQAAGPEQAAAGRDRQLSAQGWSAGSAGADLLRHHAGLRHAASAWNRGAHGGTMAHPLNRAMIHPRLRIVTAGYGILQPRVGVSVVVGVAVAAGGAVFG